MSLRLAYCHYGDFPNLGDALFPHVVRNALTQRRPDIEFGYFAPTANPCGQLSSRKFDFAEIDGNFDAVIVAGGEVVHRADEILAHIYKANECGELIYSPTDLVFAPASCRAQFRAWISVGAPPGDWKADQSIKAALPSLSHISVRGELSRRRLLSVCPEADVEIVPDLGWHFPKLVGADAEPALQQLNLRAGEYIAFNASRWIPPFVEDHLAAVAASLLRLEDKYATRVVLTPIMDFSADRETLWRIADMAGGRLPVVSHELSYEARVGLLSSARAYVGQSLHGAVAAMSGSTPAGAVVAAPNSSKFAEFFAGVSLPQLHVESWDALELLVTQLMLVPASGMERLAASRSETLDRYFDRLVAQMPHG